jgi:hypothetical protein
MASQFEQYVWRIPWMWPVLDTGGLPISYAMRTQLTRAHCDDASALAASARFLFK